MTVFAGKFSLLKFGLSSLNTDLYSSSREFPRGLVVMAAHKKKTLRRKVKQKLEVWKEILPSIGKAELYRLVCRLKRHARIFSCKIEQDGKISLILGYTSTRKRVNTRVLISSWIGKRSYNSYKLSNYRVKGELKRFTVKYSF
jgi:hypothetical protein